MKKKITAVENSHELNTCHKTNQNPSECLKLKEKMLAEQGIAEEDLIEHAPHFHAMNSILNSASRDEELENRLNSAQDKFEEIKNRHLTLEAMRKAVAGGATDLIPAYIKLKDNPSVSISDLDDELPYNNNYQFGNQSSYQTWLSRELEKEAQKCNQPTGREQGDVGFSFSFEVEGLRGR